MTSLLTWVHVETMRLGGAIRHHWRRLLAGGFCGWVASSVLGAFAIVWLEDVGIVRSEDVVAILGATIVWGGIGVGALVAYAIRPQPQVQPVENQ